MAYTDIQSKNAKTAAEKGYEKASNHKRMWDVGMRNQIEVDYRYVAGMIRSITQMAL